MKKFIYFSCLVFVISACFIVPKAGVLKQATNKSYAEYVHKYNKIKKVAEQYENNIVLSHSNPYYFGTIEDDSLSEEERKKYESSLGKYDAKICVNTLGLDYESLTNKMNDYMSKDDSIKFSEIESTATSFYDYVFTYYYDTERNVLIQNVQTGYNIDDDEWHDNQEYYIWNEEGVLTYGRL